MAIVGVTCRTILAACVCPFGVGLCRGVFFDLRPIQEGIRFVCRDAQTIDLDSLTEAIAEAAPIGWRPQVRFDDQSELSPPSHPGAVLTVEYVPHVSPDLEADEVIHAAAFDAIGEDAGAHHGGQPAEFGRSRAGGQHGSNGGSGSAQGGDMPPDEEALPDLPAPDTAAALEGDRVPLRFLLYSPEYKPEGFAPGLTPPLLFSLLLRSSRSCEPPRTTAAVLVYCLSTPSRSIILPLCLPCLLGPRTRSPCFLIVTSVRGRFLQPVSPASLPERMPCSWPGSIR